MTVDEIVAEMQRKPDAHALVEWIQEFCLGIPVSIGNPFVGQIEDAITAYFEGLGS